MIAAQRSLNDENNNNDDDEASLSNNCSRQLFGDDSETTPGI